MREPINIPHGKIYGKRAQVLCIDRGKWLVISRTVPSHLKARHLELNPLVGFCVGRALQKLAPIKREILERFKRRDDLPMFALYEAVGKRKTSDVFHVGHCGDVLVGEESDRPCQVFVIEPPVDESALPHGLGKGKGKRLLRSNLLAEDSLARRLVNSIVAVRSVAARLRTRKLHTFKYARKTKVGEKLANAGEMDEYFELFCCQIHGRWGNVFEDVKVCLVRYDRQNSMHATSLWSWRRCEL